MHKRRSITALDGNRATVASLLLLVGLLGIAAPANSASSPPVECDSVITRDIRLNNDVGPCTSDGLVVAASDVTIDLNGHRILGTQRANVGIRLESVNNVTVSGGTVGGFGVGVLIVGGLANTVSHLTVQDNRFGIQVENAESNGHRIEKNTVTGNRLIGILLSEDVSGATISKNSSSGNTGYGIVVDGGSSLNLLENNEANNNGDVGIELRAEDLIFNRTNLVPPVLDLVLPDQPPYIDGIDYHVMAGGATSEVTSRLVPIDIALDPAATSLTNPIPADTSTSGCELGDYSAAGFQRGDVALIQRGTCTLDSKILRASEAGASGVVIFNEGQAPDRIGFDFGAVGEPFAGTQIPFPVLSTTYGVGYDLYNLTRSGPVMIRLRAVTSGDAVAGTPATHDNLVIKNSATSAADENRLCGSNQWIKNDFEHVNRPCVAGDDSGETGPVGLGARSHDY